MSDRHYDATLLARWEELDLWACVYCSKPFEDVEHMMPVSLGGTNDIDNLYPACRDCNRGEGGKFNLHPMDWIIENFPALLRLPVIVQHPITES